MLPHAEGNTCFCFTSCSLTLAHLLPPYDWPVWHHVTKHHTAISGVQSHHTGHSQNARRHACWCQPLWHLALSCNAPINNNHQCGSPIPYTVCCYKERKCMFADDVCGESDRWKPSTVFFYVFRVNQVKGTNWKFLSIKLCDLWSFSLSLLSFCPSPLLFVSDWCLDVRDEGLTYHLKHNWRT